MNDLTIAVLDGVLIVVPSRDSEITQPDAQAMRSRLRAMLPGWEVILFGNGGHVVDLRPDDDAKRLASDLLERIREAVPV